MNRNQRFLRTATVFVVLSALQLSAMTASAQGPGQGQRAILEAIPLNSDTTHSLSKHFTPATRAKKAPDAKGFIQRWLVLEPIKKNIARNNILTENYLRTSFSTENFSDDFNAIPKNGEKVKLADQELEWHAVDSKTFDFNLNHFSYALNKPEYGVLYWLVTVINCPEDIPNVRLAAGCNSAGTFWLNGKEVLMLPGDQDMVVDNCTSNRITLKKGRNVIRAAVINGPGMISFCVRFLDENLKPVKNFTTSCE